MRLVTTLSPMKMPTWRRSRRGRPSWSGWVWQTAQAGDQLVCHWSAEDSSSKWVFKTDIYKPFLFSEQVYNFGLGFSVPVVGEFKVSWLYCFLVFCLTSTREEKLLSSWLVTARQGQGSTPRSAMTRFKAMLTRTRTASWFILTSKR